MQFKHNQSDKCKIQSIASCLVAFLCISFAGICQETGTDETFFISKGRAYGSLTFSLDHRTAENENQLLRLLIAQDRYNYRIMGNGGYAIKDNFTVGMSAGYGRQREELTYLNENEEEVTSMRLQQGLSIAPNFRNYVPLGNGQLQILVQTELGLTFGESLQRLFYTNESYKINGDFIKIDLGVSPGLVLFFDKNWAFETTVGIAGFSTRIYCC